MEDSRLGCHGDRASSLIIRWECWQDARLPRQAGNLSHNLFPRWRHGGRVRPGWNQESNTSSESPSIRSKYRRFRVSRVSSTSAGSCPARTAPCQNSPRTTQGIPSVLPGFPVAKSSAQAWRRHRPSRNVVSAIKSMGCVWLSSGSQSSIPAIHHAHRETGHAPQRSAPSLPASPRVEPPASPLRKTNRHSGASNFSDACMRLHPM